MLKQYKLRNYHFQLVVSILVLNIIGILIIGSAKHSVQKMQSVLDVLCRERYFPGQNILPVQEVK